MKTTDKNLPVQQPGKTSKEKSTSNKKLDSTGIDTDADKTGTDDNADATESEKDPPRRTKKNQRFDKPKKEGGLDRTGIDTDSDKTKKEK